METVSYGGGSAMFWSGISIDRNADLVYVSIPGGGRSQGSLIAHQYIMEILESCGPVCWLELMHDNARCHIAIIVKDFLRQVGIKVMDWPARSPDLNHRAPLSWAETACAVTWSCYCYSRWASRCRHWRVGQHSPITRRDAHQVHDWPILGFNFNEERCNWWFFYFLYCFLLL